MRIFKKNDGGIVQLINKEKIREWPPELPFIFIEEIKTNRLPKYRDETVQDQIQKYLEDLEKNIAIPRLKKSLESSNDNDLLLLLERLEDKTQTRSEIFKFIKPNLEKLTNSNNSKIKKLAKEVLNNISH